jgi:hypothetical protein
VGRINRGFGEVNRAKAPMAYAKINLALIRQSSLKRSPHSNSLLQPCQRRSFANALVVAVDTCKCKGHIEERYG